MSSSSSDTVHPCSASQDYVSVNGHPVWCYKWDKIEGEKPKAVLHIIHGMQERANRYDPVALALNKAGIIVCAHDNLGHGKTNDKEKSKTRGLTDYPFLQACQDVRTICEDHMKTYPGLGGSGSARDGLGNGMGHYALNQGPPGGAGGPQGGNISGRGPMGMGPISVPNPRSNNDIPGYGSGSSSMENSSSVRGSQQGGSTYNLITGEDNGRYDIGELSQRRNDISRSQLEANANPWDKNLDKIGASYSSRRELPRAVDEFRSNNSAAGGRQLLSGGGGRVGAAGGSNPLTGDVMPSYRELHQGYRQDPYGAYQGAAAGGAPPPASHRSDSNSRMGGPASNSGSMSVVSQVFPGSNVGAEQNGGGGRDMSGVFEQRRRRRDHEVSAKVGQGSAPVRDVVSPSKLQQVQDEHNAVQYGSHALANKNNGASGAPGYQQGRGIGIQGSSNSFATGSNQNCGNMLTDRPITRVLAPPGGHTTISFG